MSDKVISLFGDPTGPEADADLVEALEELLQSAKDGQITGIAIAATMADGGVITGIHRTPASSVFVMIGGVAHLLRCVDEELLA